MNPVIDKHSCIRELVSVHSVAHNPQLYIILSRTKFLLGNRSTPLVNSYEMRKPNPRSSIPAPTVPSHPPRISLQITRIIDRDEQKTVTLNHVSTSIPSSTTILFFPFSPHHTHHFPLSQMEIVQENTRTAGNDPLYGTISIL